MRHLLFQRRAQLRRLGGDVEGRLSLRRVADGCRRRPGSGRAHLGTCQRSQEQTGKEARDADGSDQTHAFAIFQSFDNWYTIKPVDLIPTRSRTDIAAGWQYL